MDKLNIVIKCEQTPHSSLLARATKAIENLYYCLLFTGPGYAQRQEVWPAWLGMGFTVTIKEPPRAAQVEDRLRLNVQAKGPETEARSATGNEQALRQLTALLGDVNGIRDEVRRGKEIATWEAVAASPRIKQSLLSPLGNSLKTAGLNNGQTDAYMNMVRESLQALMNDNVVSIESQPA